MSFQDIEVAAEAVLIDHRPTDAIRIAARYSDEGLRDGDIWTAMFWAKVAVYIGEVTGIWHQVTVH